MLTINRLICPLIWLLVVPLLHAQEKKVNQAPDGTKPPLPATARKLEGHKDWVMGIAFSSDGRKLASVTGTQPIRGRESQARLWDLNTGKLLFDLPGAFRVVKFSPDCKLLATFIEPNTVSFWEVETGRQIRTLENNTVAISDFAFSPDGKTLVTGDFDVDRSGPPGMIRFWDVATGRTRRQIDIGRNWVSGLTFSPDGKSVALIGSAPGIWDVATGERVVALSVGASVDVSYSQDGTTLGMQNTDRLHIMDTVDSNKRISLPLEHGCFAFATNGRFVTVSRGGKTPNVVCVSETLSGREICRLPKLEQQVCSLAYSSDGNWMATGAVDGSIVVLNFAAEWKKSLGELPKADEPEELDKRWADLASNDTLAVYRAEEAMLAEKRESILFLKKKVEFLLEERARIWELVGKLGDDRYTVRAPAYEQLKDKGMTAASIVRERLKRTSCFETHRLLWKLRNALPAWDVPQQPDGALVGEALHYARVLRLLDRIGTNESRTIAESLKQGLATVPPEPETTFERDALKALQGTWTITAIERRGFTVRRSPEKKDKPNVFTTFSIENGQIIDKGTGRRRQLRIDAWSDPKQFDIVDEQGRTNQTGIYRITDGTLEICWGGSNVGRPTKFKTMPDPSDSNVLHTLERATEKDLKSPDPKKIEIPMLDRKIQSELMKTRQKTDEDPK